MNLDAASTDRGETRRAGDSRWLKPETAFLSPRVPWQKKGTTDQQRKSRSLNRNRGSPTGDRPVGQRLGGLTMEGVQAPSFSPDPTCTGRENPEESFLCSKCATLTKRDTLRAETLSIGTSALVAVELGASGALCGDNRHSHTLPFSQDVVIWAGLGRFVGCHAFLMQELRHGRDQQGQLSSRQKTFPLLTEPRTLKPAGQAASALTTFWQWTPFGLKSAGHIAVAERKLWTRSNRTRHQPPSHNISLHKKKVRHSHRWYSCSKGRLCERTQPCTSGLTISQETPSFPRWGWEQNPCDPCTAPLWAARWLRRRPSMWRCCHPT